MKFRHAKVKTLDGHAYPGLPRWVEIDGHDQEIDSIEERWQEAYMDSSFYPQIYYRVVTSGRRVCVLRYSTLFGSWWIGEPGEMQ